MRLPVIVTLGLCVIAGALGLVAGLNATPREGDVIEAAAAAYAAETGRSPLECVGTPGDGAVWIVVRCGGEGDGAIYHFDRRGGIIPISQDLEA